MSAEKQADKSNKIFLLKLEFGLSPENNMDKKKRKHKDDYSLRTLAYYQREGGVYNELITILQRMSAGKGGRKILPPKEILNAATGAFDIYMDRCKDEETNTIIDYGMEELSWEIYGGCIAGPLGGWEGKNELIALCVLCVLLSQYPAFNETSIPQISDIVKQADETVFKEFEGLIKNNLEDKDAQLEFLKNQLEIKEAIIKHKDLELATYISMNSLQENLIEEMKAVIQINTQDINNLCSGFDSALCLESILEWAKKRKHYKLADQVISMLKDLGRKTATDEELEKIELVESELLSKYSELSIVNNNMGIGSNILTGLTQSPMMPMGITPDQLVQKFLEFINNGARRENKD